MILMPGLWGWTFWELDYSAGQAVRTFAYLRKGTDVYERASFERHCVGFMYMILKAHYSNLMKCIYFSLSLF